MASASRGPIRCRCGATARGGLGCACTHFLRVEGAVGRSSAAHNEGGLGGQWWWRSGRGITSEVMKTFRRRQVAGRGRQYPLQRGHGRCGLPPGTGPKPLSELPSVGGNSIP